MGERVNHYKKNWNKTKVSHHEHWPKKSLAVSDGPVDRNPKGFGENQVEDAGVCLRVLVGWFCFVVKKVKPFLSPNSTWYMAWKISEHQAWRKKEETSSTSSTRNIIQVKFTEILRKKSLCWNLVGSTKLIITPQKAHATSHGPLRWKTVLRCDGVGT